MEYLLLVVVEALAAPESPVEAELVARCAVGKIKIGTFVVGVPIGMCHGSYLSSLFCKLHGRAHSMMSSLCLCFWLWGRTT